MRAEFSTSILNNLKLGNMDKFKRVPLVAADSAGEAVKHSSLPLVLPNNVKYDAKSGRLTHTPGVKRTHLEVVPSTVALLSTIRDPLAVVSIAGMARSGKSYILSRLLGSSDAFKLGHSMDPETFGIWIGTQVGSVRWLKKNLAIAGFIAGTRHRHYQTQNPWIDA